MGVERYVVEAVVLGGMSHREAARRAGVSKAWVTKLVARYHAGGDAAVEPQSRRPHTCAHTTAADIVAAVLELRRELGEAGHDDGPHTIRHHLSERFPSTPSVTTIWRILKRHDLITPQPQKRPKASFVRFEAALPNEMWQADCTHWHLATGSGVEILNFVDDHSRLLLACTAFTTVKGLDVVETFSAATQSHGVPASLLTDNGAVFTARPRKGKGLLETELERLGVTYKNARPYHPQTCGKVERFHQTLKRYLGKQAPPQSLAVLQAQLDTFSAYYNQRRPHRALSGAAPLAVFNQRLKARPDHATAPVHYRVRRDHVCADGKVTLRYESRLFHIGIGRAYRYQPITLLIADRDIRILDNAGVLIRALTLDPTRNYQPQTTPQLGHYDLQQAGTMS